MWKCSLLTLALALSPATLGCGSDGGGGGGGDGADASESGDSEIPECSDGQDNDGDGLADGDDPHCTGPEDDREDSFATGIPGDNIDAEKQDCFFDGNSGQGDDGCEQHVCCLLDECPPEYQDKYDPDDCDISTKCQETCGAITPPGCDCFGCCTVCNDVSCYDVFTNPATAPECDVDVLDDPDKCPTCTKRDDCGPSDCDDEECVLCPGQLPEDLPSHCDGQNECPGDTATCMGDADCLDGQYCNNGCCINVIE